METQQVANIAVSKRAANKRKFSLEVKMEAINAYKKGERMMNITKRLNTTPASIYNWIKSYKRDPQNFAKSHSKVNPTDLVNKVVEDIRAGKKGAHSRSFAEDFGISQEPPHNSNIELKFCPCCGTNIKAVRIALETCQEIKG
jgi:transposase-like protein